MEEAYKKLILDLQKQRGDVKTFVVMDGIGPRAILKTREALAGRQKDKEVDIILHSPGGSPADAYRLIRSFRERYEVVNVVVPFWAKSAATLFAFGASKIVLHEFGELGPIDAQIRKDDEEKPSEAWESALNVQASLAQIEDKSSQNFVNLLISLQNNPDVRIGRKQLAEMLLKYNANLYAPLLEKIDTYEIGVMARYLDIGKMYARRILTQFGEVEPEKLDQLLDFLVYDCPDHGYVVDYAVLSNYLPNVIKSSEEPFGEEYDSILERLSSALMLADEDNMVGFIDNLTQKPQADTINVKEQPDDNNNNAKTAKPKRPSSKPSKNSGKKKSTKNG